MRVSGVWVLEIKFNPPHTPHIVLCYNAVHYYNLIGTIKISKKQGVSVVVESKTTTKKLPKHQKPPKTENQRHQVRKMIKS
jgi:hypothetical protein